MVQSGEIVSSRSEMGVDTGKEGQHMKDRLDGLINSIIPQPNYYCYCRPGDDGTSHR